MLLIIHITNRAKVWVFLIILTWVILPSKVYSQNKKITDEMLEQIFNRPGYCGNTNYSTLPAIYHLDPLLYNTENGKAFLHSKIIRGKNKEKSKAINLLLRGDDRKIHDVLIYLFKQNNNDQEVASKLWLINNESVINLLNSELNRTDKSNYSRIDGILESIVNITNPKSIPYIESFLKNYKNNNQLKDKAKTILNILVNFNKDEKSKLKLYHQLLFQKSPKDTYHNSFNWSIRKARQLNDRKILNVIKNGIKENPEISRQKLKYLVLLRARLGDKKFTKEELLIIKQKKNVKKQRKKRYKKALRVIKRQKDSDKIQSRLIYDF